MLRRLPVVLLAVAATVVHADHHEPGETEFRPLFNGTDLEGWHGDDRFWSVRNGAIVGETTPDNPAPHNTFLICDAGKFGDFELRFSYKVAGFNSGMQYRSVEEDDFVVSGYQADFEARWHDDNTADKFTGMFFEENGRMFMGQRGQAVTVRPGGDEPEIDVIATVGDPDELESNIDRDGGWNDYIVIADGYQFTHIVNGRVMSMGYDLDPEHRRPDGIFALQLHSGTPMRIDVKDIRVRRLISDDR